jgi:hypothetical protein
LYAYRRWRETGPERRVSLQWRRSSPEEMARVGVRRSRGDGRELAAWEGWWGKKKKKEEGKRGEWKGEKEESCAGGGENG